MGTLSSVRSKLRDILNESDTNNSHFTDSELNGYINQSQGFLATLIEHPRQFWPHQVTEGDNEYSTPSDMVSIISIYFGNTSTADDVRPLVVLTEETMKMLFPSWLTDASLSTSKGRPSYAMMKSKTSLLIHPSPNAAESVTGKKIHMNYVYLPADLSSDSDTPTVPLPYHDILQFYAAHLAYSKLQIQQMADKMLKDFLEKVKALQGQSTKETQETVAWQWGFSDGLDPDRDGGISF